MFAGAVGAVGGRRAVAAAWGRWRGEHVVADGLEAFVPGVELLRGEDLLDVGAEGGVFGGEFGGHVIADGFEGGEAFLVDIGDLFGLGVGEEEFVAHDGDEMVDGGIGAHDNFGRRGRGMGCEDEGGAPSGGGAAGEDGGERRSVRTTRGRSRRATGAADGG